LGFREESSQHVVKILAGNVILKVCRPVATLLGRYFIQRVIPQNEPGRFDFADARQSVALAALLHGRIMLNTFLKQFDCIPEKEFCLAGFGTVGVLVLQKVHQMELRGCPDSCFQALTNELALDFYSCKICPAADVLQQVRNTSK
jgi:hypothetical protein